MGDFCPRFSMNRRSVCNTFIHQMALIRSCTHGRFIMFLILYIYFFSVEKIVKSLNLDRIIPSTPGRRTADLSESAFYNYLFTLEI